MAIVNCPTGLAVEIRGMKTKEMNLITDTKRMRENIFDHILPACTVNVLNPGPYVWAAGGKPFDWVQASVPDRTVATLAIRTETFGDAYAFDVVCEVCRKKVKWELNLSDLPKKEIPDDVLAAFKDGNKVEYTLSDGKKMWYRALLTGADINQLSAAFAKSTSNNYGLLLAARIIEIEGVPSHKKMAFIEDMDARVSAPLIELFENSDGGVDNLILVECNHCYAQQEARLPFDHTFFLQRPRKQN